MRGESLILTEENPILAFMAGAAKIRSMLLLGRVLSLAQTFRGGISFGYVKRLGTYRAIYADGEVIASI
jgi:hypothetical protein